jgi:FkbM family methyltransferase
MVGKRLAKEVAIALNAYRPLKRAHRKFFDHAARAHYVRSVEFYRQFVDPNDLCFDVGANIGEKAEVLLDLGARVIAFEPLPRLARETRARCGRTNRLVVVNAAVGSRPGRLPIYVAGRETMSSLVKGWASDVRRAIDVPVVTLDQYIARHGVPRFCKIDVEGYELEVIHGLSVPIAALSLEYTHEARDIEKVIQCVDSLSRFGHLELNVTLGEEPRFAWPTWIRYAEFRQNFPSRAPRTEVCGFGDLFVRLSR